MDGFIPVSFCNLTKTAEVACATKCISKNLLLFYFHQNLLHKTNHHLSCDPCLESVDHVFTVCNLCFSKGGLLAGEEVVSGVGEGVGGGWSEVFSELCNNSQSLILLALVFARNHLHHCCLGGIGNFVVKRKAKILPK